MLTERDDDRFGRPVAVRRYAQANQDEQALRKYQGEYLTTKGSSRYDCAEFRHGDVFLFGPETRGLPAEILESLPASQKLRLPMTKGSRSMNLSNTVAVMLFEAWRQNGFAQGA